LKQIDPVGPSGETMLDYAVFDALRAGFKRVVFVIRRDFAENFRAQVGAKYAGHIAVDYVFQSPDLLPPGCNVPPAREKPWGTGHAVWCARDAIRENFAVINADDFYGADSFGRLAEFLASAQGTHFAMAGFRLDRTLSEHGTVSRGVCTADPAGALRSIVEQTGIATGEVGRGKKFSGAEIVSMNCWGFTPALFPLLDRHLREFLGELGTNPLKAEFYLPTAVSAMIARGEAGVRVLPTTAEWFGITYREDKPRVQAALAALVGEKKYPARLFPALAGRAS
jgi:NDP-sugar pyrophosphorylase family protein